MSTVLGYATQKKAYTQVTRLPKRKVGLYKEMKPTLKQRFFNWLSGSEDIYIPDQPVADSLNSNGIRFNIHKAHGGFVVETRAYDERNDRNTNKMYVITEDKDLGEELGKIITMESLR